MQCSPLCINGLTALNINIQRHIKPELLAKTKLLSLFITSMISVSYVRVISKFKVFVEQWFPAYSVPRLE